MGIAGKHVSPISSAANAAGQDRDQDSVVSTKPADERVRRESWFGHILNRPEFAAISGAVLVFIVFGIGAGSSGMFNLDGVMNWSQVAA